MCFFGLIWSFCRQVIGKRLNCFDIKKGIPLSIQNYIEKPRKPKNYYAPELDQKNNSASVWIKICNTHSPIGSVVDLPCCGSALLAI